MSNPIKVKEAFKIMKKEWPTFPQSACSLIITNGGIPSVHSSKGKRAHRFVRVEDIRAYYKKMGF